MSPAPPPPPPSGEQHPSELETSVETMAAEVMAGFGLQQPATDVPLEEVAELDELNQQQPLSDEELARQALEAGGGDQDPDTPE